MYILINLSIQQCIETNDELKFEKNQCFKYIFLTDINYYYYVNIISN